MQQVFMDSQQFSEEGTYIRVILKVTISLTPYPLFQWFLQSKILKLKSQYEMLKLNV